MTSLGVVAEKFRFWHWQGARETVCNSGGEAILVSQVFVAMPAANAARASLFFRPTKNGFLYTKQFPYPVSLLPFAHASNIGFT